jgi:hypothetical protein
MNFKSENEKHEIIIRQFDDHLTQKSSKTAVAEVYEYIKANCSNFTDQALLKEKVDKSLEQLDFKMKEQSNMLEMMAKGVQRTIRTEVQKATAHLQESNMTGQDAAANPDGNQIAPSIMKPTAGLQKIFDTKVNKDELPEILSTKANKADSEMAIRSIEILHK